MERLRAVLSVLSLIVIAFLTSITSEAQVRNTTSDQANPVAGVPHDTIKLLNETVSPSTGSLSIRINVPLPHSTFGPAMPFHIDYDSSGTASIIATESDFGVIDSEGPMTMGGWSYGVPMLSYRRAFKTKVITDAPVRYKTCYYATDFIFRDPTGGRHSLNLMYVYPNQPDCTNGDYGIHFGYTSILTGGDTFYKASFNPNGPNNTGEWLVTASDGTKYTFYQDYPQGIPTGQNEPSLTYSDPAMQYLFPGIQDANGNGSSEPGGSVPDKPYPGSLCDPHGRCVTWDGMGSAPAVGSTLVRTIAVPGLANPYLATWKRLPESTASRPTAVKLPNSATCSVTPPVASKQDVISAIALPNGTQYQFEYDPGFGGIQKITYPTGGWVSFEWGWNSQSELAYRYFEDGSGAHMCAYTYSTPAITRRKVSFDGVNVALQQDFTYSTTWLSDQWKWSSKKTTVVSHDFVSGQISQVEYTYLPIEIPPSPPSAAGNRNSQVPYEDVTTYKDGAGTVFRTVQKQWSGDRPAQVTCDAAAQDGGPTHVTTYAYGNGGVLTNKKEYDFGAGVSCTSPGTLVRETATEYQSFADPSILDRPAHVWTKDAAGNAVAQTDNSYDDHGNLASTTNRCLKNCSGSPPTVTTSYSYNSRGQVITMTAPNGNAQGGSAAAYTTTYDYDSNKYPSSITLPAVNGIAQQRTFSYNGTTGLLISSTDVNNGATTTYEYQDSLNRLTKIIGPGSSLTSFSYNDGPYNPAAPSPSVTTTKKIDSSKNSVSTVATDGLGQIVRTINVDPEGNVFTDTTYDGYGRVWKSTNPYRTSSDLTFGTTTNTYDTLGRIHFLTRPDGAVVTTVYDANCITVTDEAQRQRKSCMDVLGRLIRVEEPGAAQ